ncbi:MAG: fasciclin domain-containing protein [Rhodospirillaceae bacterium]|nr:fasciclin domain-containing protein [Rhodospirillaceae bacterium]
MSTIRKLMIAGAVAAATALAGVSASAQPNPPPSHLNVAERLAAAGGFDTLLAAAAAGGWSDRLAGVPPYDRTEYTVLAPTDEAFAAISDEVDRLLLPENYFELQTFLKAHIFAREWRYSELENDFNSPMTFDMNFQDQDQEDVIAQNPIELATPDLRASNGVIHVIDEVILP